MSGPQPRETPQRRVPAGTRQSYAPLCPLFHLSSRLEKFIAYPLIAAVTMSDERTPFPGVLQR